MRPFLSISIWVVFFLATPLLVLALFLVIANQTGGGYSFSPITIPWPSWLPQLTLAPGQQQLLVDILVVLASIIIGMYITTLLWHVPWGKRRRAVKEKHHVTFYTKPNCTLCVEAQRVLERVARRYDVQIDEVDITSDRSIYRQYDIRIPVLVVDGRRELEGRIDERDLRLALEGV